MFSDLASIIFGYSNSKQDDNNEAANSNNTSDTSASSSGSQEGGQLSGEQRVNFGPKTQQQEEADQASALLGESSAPTLRFINERSLSSSSSSSSLANSTASALEQTLNAATTKFTEQLLPQSTSIEQLQSSSHQLLPTLKEQHEEEEEKRSKQEIAGSNEGANQDDDEVDDDFNADSWELLDLIEKPEVTSKQEVDTKETPGEKISDEKSSGLLARSVHKDKKSVTSKGNEEIINEEDEDEADEDDDDEEEDDDDEDDDEDLEDPLVIREKGLEESWYVTPPPCFTGSSKLLQKERKNKDKQVLGTSDINFPSLESSNVAKNTTTTTSSATASKLELNKLAGLEPEVTKVAARENELIEHPSVYIAQSVKSKSVQAEFTKSKCSSSSSNSSASLRISKRRLADVVKAKPAPLSLGSTKGTTTSSSRINEATTKTSATSKKTSSSTADTATKSSTLTTATKSTISDLPIPSSSSTTTKQKAILLKRVAQRGGGASTGSSATTIDSGATRTGNGGQQNVGSGISYANSVKVGASKSDSRASKSHAPKPSTSVGVETTGPAPSSYSNQVPPSAAHKPSASRGSYEYSEYNASLTFYSPDSKPSTSYFHSKYSSMSKASGSSSHSYASYSTPGPGASSFTKVSKRVRQASTSSSMGMDAAAGGYGSTDQKSSTSSKKKRPDWANKFIVTNWADDEQDDVDDFDNMFDDMDLNYNSSSSSHKKKKDMQKLKVKLAKAKTKLSSESQSAPKRSKSPVPSTGESSTGGYDSDVSFGLSERPSTGAKVKAKGQVAMSVAAAVATVATSAKAATSVEPVSSENVKPEESAEQADDEPSVAKGTETKSTDAVKGSEPKRSVTPTKLVRPIEPERRPGWQLKRQRSRRRPLATVSANQSSDGSASGAKVRGCGGGKKRKSGGAKSAASSSDVGEYGGNSDSTNGSSLSLSAGSSARSTPTLIDRIGSSIAANFSSLGFASVTPIRSTASSGSLGSELMFDQQSSHRVGHSAAANGSSSVGGVNAAAAELAATRALKSAVASEALVSRKRLAKNFLVRQNANANRTTSSGRRPSRRLKMHSHQNGVSVNRKVQTQFH